MKDFRNGGGDSVPPELLKDLPQAVIAQLNTCYPGAFGKIDRTATGSAEELIVEGTITEHREDSGEESRAGGSTLVTDVTFADGRSGRVLMQISGELPKVLARPLGERLLILTPFLVVRAITLIPVDLLAYPFLGTVKIDVNTAGGWIADAIAEKRGIAKNKKKRGSRRRRDPWSHRSAAVNRKLQEEGRC